MVEKKNVILGITGGIAAYKMVEVASSLTKIGFSVHVVMTPAGAEFVTPLTFENITHNPVEMDLFSPPEHYNVKHISLADRADICLIAPATANFIGKMAGGIADNLLLTLVMATEAPVMIAPSMNVHMFENPIVQERLKYLKKMGYKIIEPASGSLACGYQGKGRLPEPSQLVETILKKLTPEDLKGTKILITAGPTRESLDPVRYLSNYSSGKMGYALARAASYRGANVTLISGPTALHPPSGVEFLSVNTAIEMEKEVDRLFPEQDIVIMAAAVADYRPDRIEEHKIKKSERDFTTLKLVRNPDILSGIGKRKNQGQFLVGFALESRDLLAGARKKLLEKNLDMIVANRPEAMASEKNAVTVISSDYKEDLPVQDKNLLAEKLLNIIHKLSRKCNV